MTTGRRPPPLLETSDEDLVGEVTEPLPSRPVEPRHVAATPVLRVVAGRDLLRFAALTPGEPVLLGRDAGASLRLADPTVSKRHARVTTGADGHISIQDLGSTNGLLVNGRAVHRAALRPGDQVELGSVSLRLDLLSLDELGHLARVVERLEAADRDALTGLLTRTFIEDELPRLADRCRRGGVPLSCVFIDLDDQKGINDAWGRRAGDEVLAGVARIVLLAVRDADPCVRCGGDELLLFLPGSIEQGAAEVADRLRRSIANHDWERTAPGLQVTASLGVAALGPDEPLSDWLDRADRTVRGARSAGGNRVHTSPGPGADD